MENNINQELEKECNCLKKLFMPKTQSNKNDVCNQDPKKPEDHVNKKEGLVMFILTLTILLVGLICLHWNTTKLMTANKNEITSLNTQIRSLREQIISLEDKIELFIKDGGNKPIDITINLDGEEKDYVYDPSTGNTSESNFDKRPFLGVSFYAESESETPIGLRVDAIIDSSPAKFAGMKDGDIIVSINDKKINTRDDLDAVLATLTGESVIKLQFATTAGDEIVVMTANQKLTYRGNFDLEG